MVGTVHDVDLRLLRIFLTIVESGGFSRAQAKLNLSQSAISTYMSQLETRLGTRLCQRGHGVFEITEEGRAVLRAAERLFGALEIFRTELAESRGKLAGELRIGFIDNSVTHPDARLRTAIDCFAARAPEVRLNVYVGGAIDLEERVMDGRLHLAAGLFHHQIPSLEYRTLFQEEHLLYCGSEHSFFARSDSELTAEVVAAAGYASWDYAESIPGWEPPFKFRDAASSASVEGVAFLLLSGRYLGYLPTHYARNWCECGLLRAVLPEVTRRTAVFHLVTSKFSRKHQLTCAFLDELDAAAEPAAPSFDGRA